jgi:glycosyltransferase involved in cell wall biosynthesis
MLTAIIPAHNEAPTVGAVVDAVRGSGSFALVLVIDDGSTDSTAEEAATHGARVVRLDPNRGKGEAMRAGVELAPADVAFCDADLVGVTPAHVAGLVRAYEQGYDQVCALRDYGALGNVLQLWSPLITGERIVRRWLLERVPLGCWQGFSIETALNRTADAAGAKTAALVWPGVRHRHKAEKRGSARGHWQNAQMFGRLWVVDRSLCYSGNRQCLPR